VTSQKSERATSNQLTLFAADSLASLTVWPGSEEAQQTTAISGQNIAALLPNSDPATSLARMFLESSPPCSTRCYLTWKVRATPARRSLFQLAPSMPRIDEIGSLLWPTPQAQMPGAGPDNSKVKNLLTGNRHSFYLTQAVEAERQKPGVITKMWPTPRAACPGSRIDSAGGKVLAQEVELAEGLRDPVTRKLWRTPSGTVTEPKSSVVKLEGRTPKDPQVGLADQVGGKLNPTWVEWLMGFPIGWTDLDHSETP